MPVSNAASNSGVHGGTGYEFQKHCALYVLLEQYPAIKDRKYFICLEHHEDFLFCHLTEKDLVETIQTYQAKKSSTAWGMTDELYELVYKMTVVGENLLQDTMVKEKAYTHTLNFISNNEIKLSNKKKAKTARKSQLINEANNLIKFASLDSEITALLITEIQKLAGTDPKPVTQLTNLAFGYIDLPRTYPKQVNTLVGQFYTLFGDSVVDHIAAVDTLLKLFRNAEFTLNQGGFVKLMDLSKRVTSDQINNALSIITKEQRAYTLWKNKDEEISKALLISLAEKTIFALAFKNSFDLFKDYMQVEHHKILKFVKENKIIFNNHSSDASCVEDFYNQFRAKTNSQLSDINLKATLFAAYIEVKETL